MMHSTPETRAIAQEIVNFIKTNPDRHDQSCWVFIPEKNDPDNGGAWVEKLREPQICNSTMCVAGTAAFIHYGDKVLYRDWQDNYDFEDVGQNLLGLTAGEADYLFYDTNNAEALDIVEGLAVGEWRGDEV